MLSMYRRKWIVRQKCGRSHFFWMSFFRRGRFNFVMYMACKQWLVNRPLQTFDKEAYQMWMYQKPKESNKVATLYVTWIEALGLLRKETSKVLKIFSIEFTKDISFLICYCVDFFLYLCFFFCIGRLFRNTSILPKSK